MSEVTKISLSMLDPDPAINMRKTPDPAADAELKASIAADGIQQSLLVRPSAKKEGRYRVIAGHRRLAALQGLHAEGAIADIDVPVIVRDVDDETAHRLSTVENVSRLPPHPVDEFLAFKRMVDNGQKSADIALLFGIPQKRVEQRLAYARLHKDVIEAIRAGTITLEAAQAFTLTSDTKRQAHYLKKHKAEPWQLQANSVRRAMIDKTLPANSMLARIIGEEAYLAAGGHVVKDLFGAADFWSSTDIIDKLAAEAWAKRVQGWLDEGWAWVKTEAEAGYVWDYNQIRPTERKPTKEEAKEIKALEKERDGLFELGDEGDGLDDAQEARMREIEYRLGELEAARKQYTDAQKKKSGIIYDPETGEVHFGRVAMRAAREETGGGKTKTPAKKKTAANLNVLTAALGQDLTGTMTEALVTKTVASPRLALNVLFAGLYARHVLGRTPPVTASVHQYGIPRLGDYGTREQHRLAKLQKALKVDAGKSFGAALAWAAQQTVDDLLTELAKLVAPSLDVRGLGGYNAEQQALVDFVAPDCLPVFDAADYFGRIDKGQIQLAVKEMGEPPLKDGKRAAMAGEAAALAKRKGWLPPQLRATAPAKPKKAKAKPAAKAKPKSKPGRKLNGASRHGAEARA